MPAPKEPVVGLKQGNKRGPGLSVHPRALGLEDQEVWLQTQPVGSTKWGPWDPVFPGWVRGKLEHFPPGLPGWCARPEGCFVPLYSFNLWRL